MSYVLQRVEDDRFVAKSRYVHSYVRDLQYARTYPTFEAARADACGNERILSLEAAVNASDDMKGVR